MNNPEYILVDEIGVLAQKASTNLIADAVLTTAINYQYGYLHELKTKLQQASTMQAFAALKYPLLWLVQPFSIKRVNGNYFGDTQVRFFIIQQSQATLFAEERMAISFKPVLYPVYREMIKQFNNASHLFEGTMNAAQSHTITDRYYWGENQQEQIDDIFDCMEISGLDLQISNNPNCTIPTTFF